MMAEWLEGGWFAFLALIGLEVVDEKHFDHTEWIEVRRDFGNEHAGSQSDRPAVLG